MHFHAEHSLFFEQRQSVWQAALALGLTVCMLIVNSVASNTTISLIGATIGGLLLLNSYFRGRKRMEPALTWTVTLIVFVFFGGFFLNGDFSGLAEVAARVSCGVLWILWLGTQIDWASLRKILFVLRVPETIISTLDHALMHGILTKREWVCRRNAARLRIGAASLPVSSWARLLGEGALEGFIRLERVEESALSRCSAMIETSETQPVRLDNVSVDRGEASVLKELNLELDEGECLLVCGPSGAGKSSLLRLLAGLDAPKDGALTRLGVPISADSKLSNRLDGRVALLVQNPEHHFIASTVAEDICWALLRRGVAEVEAHKRAEDMAESLGIEHLLARPCHELSFGEQRRVALAGLLVMEPKLLLLDEPTAGLDPVAAHELRNLVQRVVQQAGAACVWATHELHAPPMQAKRIVLLKSGRIIFDGPTAEGLSKPWLIRAGLAVATEADRVC